MFCTPRPAATFGVESFFLVSASRYPGRRTSVNKASSPQRPTAVLRESPKSFHGKKLSVNAVPAVTSEGIRRRIGSRCKGREHEYSRFFAEHEQHVCFPPGQSGVGIEDRFHANLPNAIYRKGRSIDPALAPKSSSATFVREAEVLSGIAAISEMARRVSLQAVDVELLLHPQNPADVHKPFLRSPAIPSLQSTQPLTRVLLQASIACVGAYLFGYHLSVVNGPMDSIAGELGFAGNAVAKGLVVSTFLVGAFLGCTMSSFAADGLGRRRGFLATALPVLLGSSLSALSTSLPLMIVGRILVGFGLGIGSPLPTLYISEIAPNSLRGTLSCIPQVAACIGILLALGAGVYFPTTPQAWRWCFWIGAIPAACLIFLAEHMVESPRWLAQKGHWSAAEKAVEYLSGPPDSTEGRQALMDLKASANDSLPTADVPWNALLSMQYRKVMLIGCGLFALQQLSGINSVFYFSSSIFRSAGIESDLVGNLAVGIVNLAAAVVSTFLMDRAGRKSLLLGSFAAMGGALGLQVACGVVCSWNPAMSWLSPPVALSSTLLYVMAFAIGAGPVPGLLLPEILPTQVRAKGFAVALSVYWIFNTVLGLTFLPLLDLCGSTGLSTFFCIMCFVGMVFTHHFVIETKGKSLEEIEALMSSR